MNNKIWVFVVIGLLLIIGFGGKVFMGKQSEISENNQVNKEIQTVQQEIALYLVKNYRDVKKIEFREFNKVEGIGYEAWNISVEVNEDYMISFSMDDLSNVEDATVRHNPKTFKLEKMNEDLTRNLDDVKIIYWEEL